MVERIHPSITSPHARAAIFDFDGTLSLIRAGWMEIMVRMMQEVLSATGTAETGDELRAAVEPFIWRNTGADTLYQMIGLAGAVRERGATPADAREYKREFIHRLLVVSQRRMDKLRQGQRTADDYLVPGSRAWLEALRERGITLYLASGTDHEHLIEESGLLGIAQYFDGGIYGARPEPHAFTKRMLVERILSRDGVEPEQLIGFGDGPVEIEELKRAGSLAVGLATDEPECRRVNAWKRGNLIQIGADLVIPNYLCLADLLREVFACPRAA